jgi:hypothetical protein
MSRRAKKVAVSRIFQDSTKGATSPATKLTCLKPRTGYYLDSWVSLPERRVLSGSTRLPARRVGCIRKRQ